MAFWKCKSHPSDRYLKNINSIQEPSIDLIDKFKIDIIDYREPKNHEGYVKCDNVERSKNGLLFILGSRVEVIIKPDFKTMILWFVNCDEIY